MLDDNDFALASAVDTSVVVLEELSLHPQPEVREAVATISILERLSSDSEDRVSRIAKQALKERA